MQLTYKKTSTTGEGPSAWLVFAAAAAAPAALLNARLPTFAAHCTAPSAVILQVNVADTETEDQAVRRYMRAVVQSGVINKVRLQRRRRQQQQ